MMNNMAIPTRGSLPDAPSNRRLPAIPVLSAAAAKRISDLSKKTYLPEPLEAARPGPEVPTEVSEEGPTVLEPAKDTSEALECPELRRRPQTSEICRNWAVF